MRLYLAGPMRGIIYNNFPAFDREATVLRSFGHEVFNPAERDRAEYGVDIEIWNEEQAKANGFSIRDALKADLSWICDNAEGIAMLPGWEKSTGATTEWALAIALGLEIRYL